MKIFKFNTCMMTPLKKVSTIFDGLRYSVGTFKVIVWKGDYVPISLNFILIAVFNASISYMEPSLNFRYFPHLAITFVGGRPKEHQKRTKVKSIKAIKELLGVSWSNSLGRKQYLYIEMPVLVTAGIRAEQLISMDCYFQLSN